MLLASGVAGQVVYTVLIRQAILLYHQIRVQNQCSFLLQQMNTRQLAKEIQATFRETFLECKQLILFDPILNCFDNARSVFTATLRTHKPQLLKQKLAQNLKVGLRVVIGEELIPVMLETVNQPAPEPDKSERSVWMIIAIVALLLFGIVFVMCILLSVVLCVGTQRGDKRYVNDVMYLDCNFL